MCVHVCLCMCVCAQVPVVARGVRLSEARVFGTCNLPNLNV